MNKTYYYNFNKFDTTFWAMMIALVMAIGCCCCCCLCAWGLFLITVLLWCYKHIKHKAEVKTVRMGRKDYKILSLTPKDKIKYHYNWLQKHNCCFGPFAIPLYGILTPEDEKEITKLVKGKVK